MSSPRHIHLFDGDSAALCFREADNEATTIALLEGLDWGPIVSFNSLEEWHTSRNAFWARLRTEPYAPSALNVYGAEELTALKLLQEADEVFLWVGACEQFFICWVVSLFEAHDIVLDKIRLIEAYSYMGPPTKALRIMGTGELSPGQLEGIYSSFPRRPLTPDDLTEIKQVWHAITAPAPEKLNAYKAPTEPLLPFLQRELNQFKRRYPDAITGLNHRETVLLRECPEYREKSARVVGGTMVNLFDTPDICGDEALFQQLLHLGDPTLPCPAVTLFGPGLDMRSTEVALTNWGRKFLSGEENFVKRNGIDSWVGGVHLSPTNVWFYHDQKIVAA